MFDAYSVLAGQDMSMIIDPLPDMQQAATEKLEKMLFGG